ncbi:MAG: ABC transporter ATP-binding protein [Alphaproteobacteria bacterium]
MSEPSATSGVVDPPILRLAGLERRYELPAGAIAVLRGVDLDLAAGQVVALVGPSGSGKSTLLHLAGLLEPPDNGTVAIAGQTMAGLSDGERTRRRRRDIGFVYQYHHLLPEFSALENIMLPQMIAGAGRHLARDRALALLERIGLSARAGHRPGELSGGEQQRVAVARALANRPRLLLADEPTGNLDPETAATVLDYFLALAREDGLAALVATHNLTLAARMDRCLALLDGRVQEATPPK